MGCDVCKRSMPELQPLYGKDRFGTVIAKNVCGICGLELMNVAHGMPRETPFAGTQAHAMFLRAVNFLGDAAPDWAKRVAKMPKLASGTVTRAEGGFTTRIDGSNPGG